MMMMSPSSFTFHLVSHYILHKDGNHVDGHSLEKPSKLFQNLSGFITVYPAQVHLRLTLLDVILKPLSTCTASAPSHSGQAPKPSSCILTGKPYEEITILSREF